jgi:dipeptidyl aminopeptidase/acylaminoacyl peptidase
MDLSPDERFIALTKQEDGALGSDIVVVDWEKNNETRLTRDPADDINPVWSNDGRRIAFTSFRKGNADIFVKNANGVGEETALVQTAADEFVEAWSRDGRYLAYLVGAGRFQDIHALPLVEGGKPFPVVQGPFRKDEPQFSNDGKWLAYTSDESASGKFEVYVISYPQLDQKRKISTDGGGQPRWGKDGKELFFRKVTHYMVAEFMPGPRIDSGVPRDMFEPPTIGGGNTSSSDPTRHQWSASADGQRFLMRTPPFGGRGVPPIELAGRGGRGGGVTTPTAVNTFTPAGMTVAAASPRGARGDGGRGGPSGHIAPVLTVILHWPAGLGKGK